MNRQPPSGPTLWSIGPKQPSLPPPEPEPRTPTPRLNGLKRFAGLVLRLFILLALVVGACNIADKQIGDGFIPWIRRVETHDPAISALLSSNRTADFSKRMKDIDAPLFWEGLQPAIKLLDTAAPEIARWVIGLHDQGRIIYDFDIPIDHPAYERTVAFQSPLVKYLLLSPGFYDHSDLDKAAILAHEYRHSRQNFAKVMAERGWQLLTLKVFINPDDNRLEDEAYLYQADFYKGFGSVPIWLQGVLEAKGLTEKKPG